MARIKNMNIGLQHFLSSSFLGFDLNRSIQWSERTPLVALEKRFYFGGKMGDLKFCHDSNIAISHVLFGDGHKR